MKALIITWEKKIPNRNDDNCCFIARDSMKFLSEKKRNEYSKKERKKKT